MRTPPAIEPEDDAGADQAPMLPRSAWIAWLPGLAILCGLVWLVSTHLVEEEEFAALLTRAQPWWLAVAAVLQVLTYVSVGEAWRIPLAAGGHRFSHSHLALLSVLKLTLDQALPTGGLSGTVFMIRRLRRSGVPREVLGATLLIVLVGYYMAYALGVFVAIAVLWDYGRLSPVVAALGATFATTAAVLPPVLVWLMRRSPHRVPARLQRLPWLRDVLAETEAVSPELLGCRRLYLATTAGSFTTMIMDAATLAATMLAVGATPHALPCFAALVMASVAATIGITPGGLGTFESASVAVLAVTGTDVAAALSATLLLRGFTFWLPMIPGMVFLRRPRRTRGAQAAAGSGTGAPGPG